MYPYKITVFTPTYNRGYIIEKLYTSLKEQTFKEFEWLIVDDGSDDNTKDLVKRWQEEKELVEINYLKTKNGGKHRAINKGVERAKGELFFIVDSDDRLTKDALEKIIQWESTLDKDEKYAGLAGNRGYSEQKLIGTTFQKEYIDATSLERKKYNISGDKAEVFYTDILKCHKFPEFEREKFVTEKIVWNEIAYEGYKIRWFNEIIYLCNYLEDGLTHNMNQIQLDNPKSFALEMKLDMKHFNIPLKKRVQMWFDYYILLRNKVSLDEMADNLSINKFMFKSMIYGWMLKCKIRGILNAH